MEWFTQNWFWLLIVVGMIAMHMFGHGGHGGHGGGHKDTKPAENDDAQRTAKPSGHHH